MLRDEFKKVLGESHLSGDKLLDRLVEVAQPALLGQLADGASEHWHCPQHLIEVEAPNEDGYSHCPFAPDSGHMANPIRVQKAKWG